MHPVAYGLLGGLRAGLEEKNRFNAARAEDNRADDKGKKRKVARLLSRAAGHLARGNHRYAARALYQAMEEDPANPEVRLRLAEVLLDSCEDWMVGGALGWEWTEQRLASVIEPLQPLLRSEARVASLKLMAKIYARFKKFREATDSLRQAVEAGAERDPEVHALLGRLYLQVGKRDRAEKCFRRAISLQPRYSPALVGLALTESQDDPRAAVGRLRQAVEADPSNTEAYCRLGETYLYQLGNVDKASLMARQALLSNPNDAAARHLLGMVYYLRGDVEAAVKEWQKTVSGLNAFGPSLHTLANLYLEQEDYGAARGYLERLLFSYPEDKEAKVKLGLATAATGDYQGASRLWEEVRQQDASDGFCRVFLADLYASLARWEEAWGALEEALDLDVPPELEEQLRDLLLEAYAHCTEYERAVRTVERAIRRFPDDPAILLAAALVHTGGKNFSVARECAERARRLRPSDPGVYRVLGVWHLERGELEAARQVLERGYALDRSDPRTACDLGEVNARQGEWEAAIAWWEEARRLDPEDMGYLKRLATAYQRNHSLERARGLWEQYLSAVPDDLAAQLAYGQVCLQQGDLVTCSGVCQTILARHRRHPLALTLMGVAAVRSGDVRRGVRSFKAAWSEGREAFLGAWCSFDLGDLGRSRLRQALRRGRYDPVFKADILKLLGDENG